MSNPPENHRELVLASTSPYRRELLERLAYPFAVDAPDVDETRLPGESPVALVERLAAAKARAVQIRFPNALIVGSDQVATHGDEVLGKPGNHASAVQQLALASGNPVLFYTGICLLDGATGEAQCAVEPFTVHFRTLSPQQIDNYLRREQPYNCAGSFKSEGLGIALFERLEGDDPSALMGLPLIRLTRMLEKAGLQLL